MKEQKVYDFVRSLGCEPLEHGAIVVKRAPETIPLAIAEFVTQSAPWKILCLCRAEIVVVSLGEMGLGLKKNASYRVISHDDVRGVSVELADGGMSRRIAIDLDDEEIVLNAQHEATSALRTSSLFGTWHAKNLPAVMAALESLGTPAATAE